MSASGDLTKRVTVHKLDPQGKELWKYEGRILSSQEHCVQLEAWYDRPDQDFHGITFRQGDRYLESHYRDRWYNVFEIYDVVTGNLKCWYCNITRPATIEDAHIRAVDLALDLLVFPDGRWLLLDEAEFEELELPAADRRRALATVQDLENLIRTRRGPFQGIR